jgi:hypothetical protein
LDGNGQVKARDWEVYAYFRILNRIAGYLLKTDYRIVIGTARDDML